ncbi:hypothetical protein [Microbacterium sp. BH-3-3-3]|uniref:hypothetical protein n=1 Tax=Microbacterium sp. BH-3-3-3 TaxID=1906742 RepID=UPI0011A87C2C|nr:hypothetical protein [Microbacterium sp. BH-3-3-3]
MAELTPDILTDAYMRQNASIRARVLAYVRAVWDGSPSLRDEDVKEIIRLILPTVQAGQLQAATLAAAFVQRLALMEGLEAPALAVDRDAVIGYRGVPADEVYRRPAVTAYSALAAGEPYSRARDMGRNRLLSMVATDLQQSRNRQSQSAYGASGFEYTIRVLSGSENCALCVIAATQRYHAGGLQPIHPGCDCGERGVNASADPGQVIDREMVEDIHSSIWEQLDRFDRSGVDLGRGKTDAKGRRISDFTDLIVTREHGELGPTLTWRQDRFTGPDDLT